MNPAIFIKICHFATFERASDEKWLFEKSKAYEKINNLEVINMQIRHIQYHIGHIESIFRNEGIKTQEWIDYLGE
jgi:hypothetical protein